MDPDLKIFFCYVYDESIDFVDPILTKVSTNNAEYNISDQSIIFGSSIGFATSFNEALCEAKAQGSRFLIYALIGNILRWKSKLSENVKNLIINNENLKFAGHIIQHPNGSFHIDRQFFLIDVDWAYQNNITEIEPSDNKVSWAGFIIKRSEEFYDDYSQPKWIKGTERKKQYTGRGEGYNIINKLVETKADIVVLDDNVRNSKDFLYPHVKEKAMFNKPKILSFTSINKVYVTNTEIIDKDRYDSLSKRNIKKVFVPASGIQMVLFSYYLKPESTTIYDVSPISLSFAERLISRWDGLNFKDFVRDELLRIDSFLHNKHYISQEDLTNTDTLIKSFGADFTNWWGENKNQFNISFINILDPSQLNIFNAEMSMLGRVPTAFHLSNIWDYRHTSALLSLEERVKLLKNFRDFWYNLIGEENFFVAGRSPALGIDFDEKINNEDLEIGYNFPWK